MREEIARRRNLRKELAKEVKGFEENVAKGAL